MVQQRDMTTVTVPTEVVVDQCMDLVAEEKTIVAKVPTKEDVPIAGEQTQVVGLVSIQLIKQSSTACKHYKLTPVWTFHINIGELNASGHVLHVW